MNFKQYDDGKEGRFFVILDNGMEYPPYELHV